MVGYVMVIYDYDNETYNIWHMMIDEKYQNNGYGTRALEMYYLKIYLLWKIT